MPIIVGLFLIWFICTLPFVMLGIPGEASAILGIIAGICVTVHLVNEARNESSRQASLRQLVRRSGSSYSSSENADDDDIDEMFELDMMDGDLDGEVDFFDKD